MEEELIVAKTVKPVLKETYALLLKGETPIVVEVSELNEEDSVVSMSNVKTNKTYQLLLNDGELVMKTDNYEIYDIERVIPFDLSILKEDIEQLNRELTSDIIEDLDISLEEIQEKDKIYTSVEIREDILSSLVSSYKAYDNIQLIQSLNDVVDNILDLYDEKEEVVYLYNIKKDKELPKWLVPVVDNPLKIYDNSMKAIDEFFEIRELTQLSYQQHMQVTLDSYRPVETSLSDVGFYTQTIHNYFRDCLTTSSCLSKTGTYRYDTRKNRNDSKIIFDGDAKITHPKDSLNMVGLVYLPLSQLKHTITYSNNLFSLSEMTRLNSISNLIPYETMRDLPIEVHQLSEDITNTELNQTSLYTFTERYESKDDYYSIVKQLTPSISDILSSLSTIRNKIMNYKDFKTLTVQYEINPYKLANDELKLINDIISTNVNNYLKNNNSLKEITIVPMIPTLSLNQKIALSKSVILSLTNIPLRNEYIQKFIRTYCRKAKHNESDLWYYNSYTNEPILCKHYELLSIYHNNKDAFDTMISLYGKQPEDGVVHCKHCGEYLCNEDFSLFDGFSDEQPILMREELVTEVNLLEKFKEDEILLVKQIAGSLGANITDDDIKLVLDIQKSLNNDILANIRYKTMNVTTSDEHPRVKDIRKKYAKEKNKKKLITNDTKAFQLFIKDTNKMIALISLISLAVQSATPSYEIKKGSVFNFIEFGDSDSLDSITYNRKYIEFCMYTTLKLCDKYKNDTLWNHYRVLSDEIRVYKGLQSIKQQIINTIHYLVSPSYPMLQDRLMVYRKFILSSKNVYINYEWPTYKPLLQSELYDKANTILLEKDGMYKDNYVLDYNNYPVENISLIHGIGESKKKLIHELINFGVSEIMVNKAFLLLFNLSVSNYGNKIQKVHSIDLHIERFLQTVTKKEEMIKVFKKNNWESSKKTGGISYKTLRTKIIPEIIATYLRIDTDLSPCFSHAKECNQFIHVNVNNYDLHLLKTKPKRVYSYKPFTVYPTGDYEQLSSEFKDKLFKRYCKDPTGKIIKRFITTDYLGKYLVHTKGKLEDEFIGVYENSMRNDESNFKEIMKAVQCELPMQLYIKPEIIGMDNYKYNQQPKLTVLRLIVDTIQKNESFDLNDNDLLNTLENISDANQTSVNSIKREINRAYTNVSSEAMIESCSMFITNVQNKKQIKRFETIFVNTSTNININEEEREKLQGDGFRYRNMRERDVAKIFEMFTNSEKLTSQLCYHYIYTIKVLLSRISNGNAVYSGIGKTLRLSKYNRNKYNDYIYSNSLLLHQDIFRRESINRGFYKYEKRYVFECLLNYIKPYTNNLDRLMKNDIHFINGTVSTIFMKYVLMLIISKLIEFNDKLKSDDSEIVSMVESEYLKYGEEMNINECVSLSEECIMDLILNMFEVHFDSRWVVSNIDIDDLRQRLSKQKEKEKQQLIHELDTMSDEKRASTVELQKLGVTSMYHKALKANEKRIIDEYSSIDEGDDLIDNKELVDAAVSISNGEIVEQTIYEAPLENIEEGYYNENDFDEDGVMGDEMQEILDEDQLDNNFNS